MGWAAFNTFGFCNDQQQLPTCLNLPFQANFTFKFGVEVVQIATGSPLFLVFGGELARLGEGTIERYFCCNPGARGGL